MNYSRTELENLNFAYLGKNVSIHKTVELINPERISIEDNSRIDFQCLLSAGDKGIHIGRFVHIGSGSYLFGQGGEITLHDFSGLSARCLLFTASDDYSGRFLTNPTVPDKYKRTGHGDIILHKHVIVGAGSVIMPEVTMETGSASGSMSFITKTVTEFTVVAGQPAIKKGIRKRDMLDLEPVLLAECGAVNSNNENDDDKEAA